MEDEALKAMEERLLLRIEQTETRLLTEFRKWAVPVTARVRTAEVTLVGNNERVGLLEERVDILEQNAGH